MIKIITPEQYRDIPWKNGKGSTTELLINDGADINNFKWRISIAKVTENGSFSDFSGFLRNLVLIKGNGITLEHNQNSVDNLDSLLKVACFNGADTTIATLTSGPIVDFNVMTKEHTYVPNVQTYVDQHSVQLTPANICFIYCLQGIAKLSTGEIEGEYELAAGHLMAIFDEPLPSFQLQGQDMIVVYLNPANH
jgi:environmental stress-induced protein Ves